MITIRRLFFCKVFLNFIFLWVYLVINTTSLKSQNTFFNDADLFFKKHVFNGMVNYKILKENPSELDDLVIQIVDFPVQENPDNMQKAFYINAYNLLVIEQVTDHFPVHSPRDIPGFFDNRQFQISDKDVTLNQLENELLRPLYKDPRIHFVLVCGANGCPPITNFAYMPENLDVQLEHQTQLALNDERFIQVTDDEVRISELFQWYEADFLQNSSGILSFINRYRKDLIEDSLKISYYPYDWSLNVIDEKHSQDIVSNSEKVSNIYAYTPSKLLKKGQVEMQLFNNLYTQTAYRDEDRNKVEQDTRDTYYSALFYALFGVSKSARINVGFDLNLKSVLRDTAMGSPLKVFRFDQTPYSRTAVTSIGPKIKFQPIKNISNFSIQSAFWIPVASDLESIEDFSDYPWMDYHMFTWWNQFLFDKTFGSKWQLFTEVDLLFRFKSKNGNIPTHVDIPVSVFVSWFPGRKMTIYFQLQYSPRFQLEKSYQYEGDTQNQVTIVDPFDLVSDFAHTGFGIKYQLTSNLNLEASTTYFFTSKNGGAGSTYNLGIRFIL